MALTRRRMLKALTVGSLFSGSLFINAAAAKAAQLALAHGALAEDDGVRDRLQKAAAFSQNFPDDVFLAPRLMPLLDEAVQRLERLKQFVGYGNFSLLGFDEARRYARNYSVIGAFPREEIELLESIFFADARGYGFWGKKVITRLETDVKHWQFDKIPGSGHYLYRGESFALFTRLQREVGEQLELTSGIRSVVKQMHLFLDKAWACGGNLSRASRSLAPPGHSYHGVGDFDVGERGKGALNFTRHFADTEVFHRLRSLDYLRIRYPQANLDGVRYEPWHIKVVSAGDA